MLKKTILILVNHDVVIYNFRKELVEELLNQDYEVVISSPYGPKIDKLINMGCIYSEVSIERHGTNIISDIKLIHNYMKLIKKFKPVTILTYTIKPNVYGGIAAQLTKTPYLANITGLGTSIQNKGFMQKVSTRLYKVGLRKANCVFFQNESNYRFFKEANIVNGNTKILPGSGVNLEEHYFEPYPEETKTLNFLYIGRIMKDKGIDELLEAAQHVKGKYPYTEFDLIGFSENEYDKKLKWYVENDIVKYHGQQNDVHSFIKKSHAIILPSYHEGMANVLLEAAATGRPIIASAIPGCKESFDNDLSGLDFEVKNVKSLINSLIKFIKLSYHQKSEMGKAGRIKMENEFDRKNVVHEYLNKINKIIEEK